MPDDVIVENGSSPVFVVATDDVGGGRQAQLIKLLYGANGASTPIQADVDGLLVNLPGVALDANLLNILDTLTTLQGQLSGGLPTALSGDRLKTEPSLPTGAATDANLVAINAEIGQIQNLLAAGLPEALASDRLKVDGSGVTQPVSGTVTVTDGGGALTVDGTVVVTDGSGSLTVDGAVTVGNAAGASAVNIQDGGNTITVDGTVTAALAAGTNNIGDVDVLTLPALPAGTNNIGDVDVLTLPSLPAGTNAIGKLAANSGVDIGDVDVTSLPALAAGTNTIGGVRSKDVSGLVDDAGADRAVKYAIIDVTTSGDNTILAAVSSRKIRVLSLYLVAAGTTTVRFEAGTGGTALSGQMSLIANVGFVLPYNPHGWFETPVTTLLNLELSATVSVDGGFTYAEVA